MNERRRTWRTPRLLARTALAAFLAVATGLPMLATGPVALATGARAGASRSASVSVEKHKHHHGKQTVKRTVSNRDAIAIPGSGAADPYPSTLTVRGFKQGRIADVNVTLRGFSHTFTEDVDVLLVAPDGRNLVVMGDAGPVVNTFVNDITLTLDDEAAAPLPIDQPLTTGRFRPLDNMGPTDSDGPDILAFPAPAPAPSGETALSTFDGINPNGEWQLFVLDDTTGDEGSFSGGWSLTITARVKR